MFKLFRFQVLFIDVLIAFFVSRLPVKLKAWEEQAACWDSQRNELEQRVEDEVEKVDKIEKYDAIMYVTNI